MKGGVIVEPTNDDCDFLAGSGRAAELAGLLPKPRRERSHLEFFCRSNRVNFWRQKGCDFRSRSRLLTR